MWFIPDEHTNKLCLPATIVGTRKIEQISNYLLKNQKNQNGPENRQVGSTP